jgi:hypothetical protein
MDGVMGGALVTAITRHPSHRRRPTVKLSAPKYAIWIISLVLGAIGLLGYLVTIPVITGLAFWFVLVGLALLLLATALKGM